MHNIKWVRPSQPHWLDGVVVSWPLEDFDRLPGRISIDVAKPPSVEALCRQVVGLGLESFPQKRTIA
jgi:hypothetical protein